MTKIHFGGKQFPSPVFLLLLTVSLIVTACSSATLIPAALSAPVETLTPSGVNAATEISTPINTTAPGATTPPQANKPDSNVNCDALYLANYNMGMALAVMVNLTADSDYTAYTTPDSPFYLDIKKIRSDLDTLATLPDPTDAVELAFGKPSETITYFRQLVDLAESDIRTQGKPFVDTSPSGQKLIGIDTPWQQHVSVFALAMEKVCRNYKPPSDIFSATATP